MDGDVSFNFLSLSIDEGRIWAYLDCNGFGELVFDSGEGALELATTFKNGSRRENYPILTQRGSDEN